MDVKAKARTYAKGPQSRRANTNVFHLRLVREGEDVKVRVCKKTFIETLGVTLSRVDRVLKKKVSTRRLSLMDDRGKHGTRPRKIQAEAVERVKRLISKFPAEESHYSRESNGGTKYISGELSLSKMYHLYLEEAEQEQFVPVKEIFYRHVFNTEFDLKFHQPRSDTCKTCEELKLNIQTADDEDEKEQLKRARDLHHRRADAARKAMKSDAKTAGDIERVYYLSFDLQQTLDTPKLPVGEAYYSRQLSTFNLAVVNNTTLHANMYVWNEADGRRGSDEIGSSLLKYIDDLPQEADHLILYSDGCGGQNKNHQLQMLWMRLVASGRFKPIDHKFLVVGHTYLPCDRCFAHIEKKKRKLITFSQPMNGRGSSEREQTEEAIQRCPHDECRFRRHRCVSQGACHDSASYNRKATPQLPEGHDILSQGREEVSDRGEVFSRPVAASKLRQL